MTLYTLVPHLKVITKYRRYKCISDVTLNLLINQLSDLIRSPDVISLALELLYLTGDSI